MISSCCTSVTPTPCAGLTLGLGQFGNLSLRNVMDQIFQRATEVHIHHGHTAADTQ
jgi:hypothetical protein